MTSARELHRITDGLEDNQIAIVYQTRETGLMIAWARDHELVQIIADQITPRAERVGDAATEALGNALMEAAVICKQAEKNDAAQDELPPVDVT